MSKISSFSLHSWLAVLTSFGSRLSLTHNNMFFFLTSWAVNVSKKYHRQLKKIYLWNTSFNWTSFQSFSDNTPSKFEVQKSFTFSALQPNKMVKILYIAIVLTCAITAQAQHFHSGECGRNSGQQWRRVEFSFIFHHQSRIVEQSVESIIVQSSILQLQKRSMCWSDPYVCQWQVCSEEKWISTKR